MDQENRLRCNGCNCFRPINDFRFNKQGNMKKTCFRHEKKRALPIDQWDSFIEEIRAWNKPVRMSSQDVLLKS
jgi:hypothetical protein